MSIDISETRFLPLGDSAVAIRLGERVDPAVNDAVHALAAALDGSGLPGIVDRVPAYASLTVHYDALCWSYDPLCAALSGLLAQAGTVKATNRLVELPVCYGGEHGPDLDALAAHAGLTPAAVIARHSAPAYRVHFLGFAPGFPYLGGLDPALAMPRRDQPRPAVPTGSVGIGGGQTGIYPQASPGGWQLIGRTPARLFDARREPPCLLAPGDSLRFRPISAEEFLALEGGA